MSLPSRVTVPAAGFSSRARPRSRVDLPQALAPTIMVTLPSGIAAVRSSITVALIVLQRQAWRSEALPSQASFRLEVTSSQSRNGAPSAPVTTPTGRTVPSSSSGAMLAAT